MVMLMLMLVQLLLQVTVATHVAATTKRTPLNRTKTGRLRLHHQSATLPPAIRDLGAVRASTHARNKNLLASHPKKLLKIGKIPKIKV